MASCPPLPCPASSGRSRRSVGSSSRPATTPEAPVETLESSSMWQTEVWTKAVDTSYLIIRSLKRFKESSCFIYLFFVFFLNVFLCLEGPSSDTVMERISQVSRTLEEFAICPDLRIDLSRLGRQEFDLENKFKPFRGTNMCILEQNNNF